MKVNTKELKGLKREVSIMLTAETVKIEMERGFTAKRKEVTLKGYRKGKAPLTMIKSLYAEAVRDDVTNNLIRSTLPDAVKESDFKIASTPTLTGLEYDKDGNLNYTIALEIFPEIKEVVLDNLELPTSKLEVSDEEVNKVTEQFLIQHSELRVVDRKVATGDVVIADMKKISDPKMAIDNEHFPDAVVDLGSDATVKEFKDNLLGLSIGEEKTIEVDYGPRNDNPKLSGAKITYLCKIKEVKERILPELNDAFAKSTGRAETALEFKIKIREEILAHKTNEFKKYQHREIVSKVCEQNQIQIPEGMVDNYLDSVVGDIKKQDPEASEEEIRERYRPIGIDSMRWQILWHHLADKEKIEVLSSDTEKWIEMFSQANNVTPKEAERIMRQSGRIESLRESIREEKVLEYLISQARQVPLAG